MAVLTVQAVTRAGLNLTDALVAASAGGDSFANNGLEVLAVVNAGGSSVTVTLPYVATADGQTITSRTVVVGAGKTALIGPFPQALYNDANNRVAVTYSGVTSVSVAALRLA